MDITSKLTIIIPPHNRPKHLERVLDYYSDIKAKILIADSSPKAYELPIPSNTRYFHFPNSSFAHKVNSVSKWIDTAYAMLLAEDDFYLVKSLSQCLLFLEENETYNSCQGNYFLFNQNDVRSLKTMYYKSFQRDINDHLIIERIHNLYQNYLQLFYSIHRANSFKRSFEEMDQLKIVNMFAVEWYIAINSLIYGKHKVLNNIYGFRENIPNSIGRHAKDLEYYTHHEEYNQQFNEVIDFFTKKINSFGAENDSIVSEKMKTDVLHFVKKQKSSVSIPDRVKRIISKRRVIRKIGRNNLNLKNDWRRVADYIEKHPIQKN